MRLPSCSFCGCTGRFESTLVANPEDRFSRDEAQIISGVPKFINFTVSCSCILVNETCQVSLPPEKVIKVIRKLKVQITLQTELAVLRTLLELGVLKKSERAKDTYKPNHSGNETNHEPASARKYVQFMVKFYIVTPCAQAAQI